MSTYIYQRSYRGPLMLVIFDWAGTMVDFGCQAPTAAFIQVFAAQGVPISAAQAREPMGLSKRDHIQAVCQMPGVAAAWREQHGRAVTDEDIDRMYADFQPRLLQVLPTYADLIPGSLQVTSALRDRAIRIGSTTGYFEAALQALLQSAAEQGYAPDSSVCATQVPAGRPQPWMIYQIMRETGVYPPAAVVKVGDTVPDVEAGLNAGVWCVAVAVTGNEMGYSQAQIEALEADRREIAAGQARQRLAQSGAHYVIDSVQQLLPILDQIESRLAQGQTP